jgi:cytochrome c oxidase cbb3-type subunit 3
MTRQIPFIATLIVLFSASWGIAEILSGNPKQGARIYQQLCLRCHGEKLDGRGPEAQDLKAMPTDLQSASSRTKSDWELLVIVAHGVMFTPMHGFRDKLSEQDIKDVLSYIRTEAPFRPISWDMRPPPSHAG